MFRLAVTLTLILSFGSTLFYCGHRAFAQSAEDVYPHITALENTILGQNFIDQPVASRLSRMEKKAFGKESNSTDLSDRTDLLDDYVEKQLHKKLRSDNDTDAGPTAQNESIQNQADYPHITALEQAILGQTFAGQTITDRLSRMESKAFGKVSSNTDLSDRTDALDDYTYNHLHKNLLQANTDVAQNNSPESEVAELKQTDYPHVTALEQAILGQTFTGQIVTSRLGRMEIKAFGSVSTNVDLGERTDALDRYARTKLHKQTLRPDNADDDDSLLDGPQKGGLLSKVEKAVLGMAGGGIAGGPGMGGLGFPGMTGMNFAGMGPPGMGNGYGGVGGSANSGPHHRQSGEQNQPGSSPSAPSHQEDPAIYQVLPPDANSKMLIKVGWCEVQLFGHTFGTMHLPERLGQLNKELHLEPGKSDIQLMDDIGLMIKAVQKRKQIGPHQTP